MRIIPHISSGERLANGVDSCMKNAALKSVCRAQEGLSNQLSEEANMPLNPVTAGAPAIQPIPVILCDAPTADEWFVMLKRLVRMAKVEPKLGESPAWRGTYAYAHARFLSAFEMQS